MSIANLLLDRDVLLAAIAFLVSLALLRLYMRAVRRSMLRSVIEAPSSDITAAGAAVAANAGPTPPPVPLELGEPERPSGNEIRSVWRGPATTAAVQIAAGSVYAIGVTLAWIWLAGQTGGWQGFTWQGFAMFTVFFAWPIVIVVGLIATLTWQAMALIVLFYVVLLVPLALYLMQGTAVTPGMFALNWWNMNGPATLFVLAILAKPIRAMGPLVAALVLAAAAGVFGLAILLDQSMIEWVAGVATSLGFSGTTGGIIVGLLIFGGAAAAAILAGYAVLRALGRLYRGQWVSDQSIQIDSVWLTFAVLQAPRELPYAGLAAFVLYKLAAWLGQGLVGLRARGNARAPRLLLLRVFSLGVRSEQLFAVFSRLWRYTGSVQMIAGPDLANTTVEPHEFLDFLAGRLHRRFIDSQAALDMRISEMQPQRDPDGRFRVTGFFCHADTWQWVLRRLARDSDIVLMDLRGFTQANQGCVYELHALLDAVRLHKILLVIDGTTDEVLLADVLAKGWADIAPHSPNRPDPSPRIRIHRLEAYAARSISKLVATLTALNAVVARPVVA